MATREAYAWEPSVAERHLSESLRDFASLLGDIRSIGSTAISLGSLDITTLAAEDPLFTQLLVDLPGGATHIRLGHEERHDHRTYVNRDQEVGLAVHLVYRERYSDDAKVEPIRFGVGLSNERGSLVADFVVPSRSMQGIAQYKLSDEENIPPRVTIALAENDGADASDILDQALLELGVNRAIPGVMEEERGGRLEECLIRLREIFGDIEPSDDPVRLSDPTMEQLEEWAIIYLFGVPALARKDRMHRRRTEFEWQGKIAPRDL